jgi:hypothetical protein
MNAIIDSSNNEGLVAQNNLVKYLKIFSGGIIFMCSAILAGWMTIRSTLPEFQLFPDFSGNQLNDVHFYFGISDWSIRIMLFMPVLSALPIGARATSEIIENLSLSSILKLGIVVPFFSSIVGIAIGNCFFYESYGSFVLWIQFTWMMCIFHIIYTGWITIPFGIAAAIVVRFLLAKPKAILIKKKTQFENSVEKFPKF